MADATADETTTANTHALGTPATIAGTPTLTAGTPATATEPLTLAASTPATVVGVPATVVGPPGGPIPTEAGSGPAAVRVPKVLREAACFPATPDNPADAAAWARVMVVAVHELASAARDATRWAPSLQNEIVAALDEVGRVASAAKVPVLAAQEASGVWRQAGTRSFEDFRARTTRVGKGVARREVAAARTVGELDGGLEALTAGTMTPVHAERLGTIAGKLPDAHNRQLLTGPRAQKIKDLAERLDAPKFAAKVEDMAAALSAQQVEDDHQGARARCHLELTPTADGMTRLSGQLDPIAAHTLQVALDAASPRPAADDERTRGQRQADALHTLATTMLAEAKNSGHARPHVLITMTAEMFAAARNHFAAGTGAHQDPGPAPVVRYQDGPLLPLSELGRTLCDSQIARLVIGADSEPLDLGRSQRLFSPAQRRAVIARDGGCAWEQCAMPARYCEVHHLDWWDDDHGHTDTNRGVLVCVYHHHELHRRNLDLTRDSPPSTSPSPSASTSASASASASDPPTPHLQGTALPGDPDHRPSTYRIVPRAQTRARREEARRTRLLAEVRTDSTARKARRSAETTGADTS